MYCTQADMQARFGENELVQLTDRERTGSVNGDVLDTAIADASAEIDGYLAGRYSLPLPVVPSALTLYACDIARYRLYEDGAYEQVIERYKIAVAYLRDLAQGKILLPGIGEDDREDNAAGFAINRKVFTGGGF